MCLVFVGVCGLRACLLASACWAAAFGGATGSAALAIPALVVVEALLLLVDQRRSQVGAEPVLLETADAAASKLLLYP